MFVLLLFLIVVLLKIKHVGKIFPPPLAHIMDLIVKPRKQLENVSPTTTTTTTTYDEVTIRMYAVRVREALDYHLASEKTSDSPIGDRPLFVGMLKRRSPPPPPPPSSPEGSEYGPGKQKRLKRSLAFLDMITDDMVVQKILVEVLFPDGMLHLNQIAENPGGRENRSRFDFETALVEAMNTYIIRQNELQYISRRFFNIIQDRHTRRMLYMKYMATPPEGLFEKPDPVSAIPEEDFNAKVKLAPYPVITDEKGNETGRMVYLWYEDFLTTVAYNEWQRALSLSTARAIQLYFWVHRRTKISETWMDFLDYWNIHNATQQRNHKRTRQRHLTRNRPDFSRARFPLTYDIDRLHLIGSGRPYDVSWLYYQTFRATEMKPRIEGYNQQAPSGIIPESPKLKETFANGHIELVRILQFRNTPDLSQLPQHVRPPKSAVLQMQSTVVIRIDPVLLRRRPFPGRGAAVIQPAYDLSTDEEEKGGAHPRIYNPGGGFVPWSSDIYMDLFNFPNSRITGLEKALGEMNTKGWLPSMNVKPMIRVRALESGEKTILWSNEERVEQTHGVIVKPIV